MKIACRGDSAGVFGCYVSNLRRFFYLKQPVRVVAVDYEAGDTSEQ